MKKQRIWTVLLIVLFLVGLSLLLYPPFSSYWNSLHQSCAIAGYLDSVDQLDSARCQELLAQADAYNAELARAGGGFLLTEEEQARFLSQLEADGGAVGYLEVPAIELRLPLYLGTSEGVLQAGAGVLEGGSLPVGGESTHAVITGHRGLPSKTLFTHLDRLEAGDTFTIHVLDRAVSYEVEQVLIVTPTELDALAIRPGEDLCTLVTCTPYGVNTHRLLVQGRRVLRAATAARPVSADAAQVSPTATAAVIFTPILLVTLLAASALTRPRRPEAF